MLYKCIRPFLIGLFILKINPFLFIFAHYNQLTNYMNPDDVPVAICSDHAGYELKETILDWFSAENISFTNFGTYSPDSCDYADFAHPMAEAIEDEESNRGIAICGTGQGMSMTLNKHQGIRAALCWSPEIAKLARQHNNANGGCLSARFISKEMAIEIINIFFNTGFDGGRHQTRIEKMPL